MGNRYSVLFEPVQIGPKTAKNRFWCSPHAGVAEVIAGIEAIHVLAGCAGPDTNVGVGTDPELITKLIPLQRAGLASEVAHTVHFLASEGAIYVSGDVIHVDGGRIAA